MVEKVHSCRKSTCVFPPCSGVAQWDDIRSEAEGWRVDGASMMAQFCLSEVCLSHRCTMCQAWKVVLDGK